MIEKCSHTNMTGAKTLGDEELKRKRAEAMNIREAKTSERTSKTYDPVVSVVLNK